MQCIFRDIGVFYPFGSSIILSVFSCYPRVWESPWLFWGSIMPLPVRAFPTMTDKRWFQKSFIVISEAPVQDDPHKGVLHVAGGVLPRHETIRLFAKAWEDRRHEEITFPTPMLYLLNESVNITLRVYQNHIDSKMGLIVILEGVGRIWSICPKE